MLQTRAASGGSRDAPGYNVVVVDWGMLADPKFSGDAGNLFYGFAVKNVPLVGRRVGEFVLFLMKNGAVRSLDQVHLIGFSLGSHVSGNAGNTLKELTGQVPARITGLDPAGPSFYKGLRLSSRQLSTEDANFVDIIHTNQGALGIYKNIGHVDFYRKKPNLLFTSFHTIFFKFHRVISNFLSCQLSISPMKQMEAVLYKNHAWCSMATVKMKMP